MKKEENDEYLLNMIKKIYTLYIYNMCMSVEYLQYRITLPLRYQPILLNKKNHVRKTSSISRYGSMLGESMIKLSQMVKELNMKTGYKLTYRNNSLHTHKQQTFRG